MFDALNGGQVRSSVADGRYTVDDYAPVVCADVRTANATVYVVSMLLIPS
nr:fasciclin domain-containing protein [Nocardiopsis ganjiahuensis]